MAKTTDDQAKLFFEHSLDIPTRTLVLSSYTYDSEGNQTGVDYKMAENFFKGLHLLSQVDKPITIMLNTPGGCVTNGMAIYDLIKSCKCHVTIKVFGEACSMGCVILQAADVRQLYPSAVVMFHEGQDSHSSNHPEIVKRWVKFNEKYGNRIDKILFQRMVEKDPELRLEKFKRMNLFDTILTAEEAVQCGLADSIVE